MSSHVSNSSCMHCGSSLGSLKIALASPCLHLLRTNHPPSELEASSIRQAITQAKNDQERLTREIAQLQATMDALCNQSNTVDAFISEHEAVFSPARRILPEILSEIFLWCFASSKLRSTKDAPIVLGHVCSYWRSVAISIPKLWSSLNPHIYNSAWLVNTALTRSATCPLTIDLTIYAGGNRRYDEHADSCLAGVLNHSRRWKSVSFRLLSPWSRKLSAVKHALPMLEALDMWKGGISDVVLDTFEVAPRLRSLCTNFSPSFLKVPEEQLIYLDCYGCEKDCLEWLYRCSNLVECKIIINRTRLGTGLLSSLKVHLPRLIKLEIMWDAGDAGDASVLEDLFNDLVTPVLIDLRIEYLPVDFIRWAQSSFVSLCRSACALHKLNLIDIPITDVQLIECLRMLPSLAELGISYNGYDPVLLPVTSIVLQQLIYRPPKLRSMPLLSPQLQDIIFRGNSMVDDQIFGDMVASRWRIHGDMGADDPTFEIARLKSVVWERYGKLDEQTRARLEKYKDEGLALYIQAMPSLRSGSLGCT